MRQLRYSVAASLDGYIAGPNGEFDWIVADPEIDFAAMYAGFSGLVMGRRSYEVFLATGGHDGPPLPVYVYSRALPEGERDGVTFARDAVAHVRALKAAGDGKPLWLWGGGELFRIAGRGRPGRRRRGGGHPGDPGRWGAAAGPARSAADAGLAGAPALRRHRHDVPRVRRPPGVTAAEPRTVSLPDGPSVGARPRPHRPRRARRAEAFQRSLDLARHAERWGYNRFWLAEHHNMPGIASAATAVLIGHVAGGTSRIRVGAGGIMLPNHAPLQVAEQFATLEALFPGRIDLGLGRAPGTDPAAAMALRRTLHSNPDAFPDDVLEVMAYFGEPQPGQRVRAVPGAGHAVPIWILGSSLFGAQVAAEFGLPFSFASHFAPALLFDALRVYRERFTPSAQQLGPT